MDNYYQPRYLNGLKTAEKISQQLGGGESWCPFTQMKVVKSQAWSNQGLRDYESAILDLQSHNYLVNFSPFELLISTKNTPLILPSSSFQTTQKFLSTYPAFFGVFLFRFGWRGVPLGLLFLHLRWWFRWLLTGTFDRVDGRVGKTNGIQRSWNRWGSRGDVWCLVEFFLGRGRDHGAMIFTSSFVRFCGYGGGFFWSFFWGGFNGGGLFDNDGV